MTSKPKFNILIDKQSDIEEIRNACIERLKGAGEGILNWSNENTSVGRVFNDDLTVELLNACTAALLEFQYGRVTIAHPVYYQTR